MAWGKIGADTATSATPTLKVDIATPNNFVSFMNHIFVSGSNNNHEVSFNSDQAYVYAHRSCANGGSEGLSTNTREIGGLSNNSSDKMQVGYVADFAGEEKLCIMFQFDAMGAGAGNAPTRCESYFKYVPSPDSRLTDIVSHDDAWFGSPTADRYATNSNLTLLGSDITPSAGKPTNVQVGSRWEETDTRKIYHYEPQVADYDYPMTTDPRTNTFNSSLCTITHANSTLQMNQITNGGAGGSATYIDLGSNLSTKWVMRFKTKQTAYTSYAGNSQFQVGMSSVAPTSTAYNISSSLNWIGIRWYYGTQIWSGGSRVGVEPRINQNTGDNTHNNSTWNGSGNDQRLYGSPREVSDTTTPYYHEIIWNVDTFTYNLYTNANYTGTPAATATMSSSTNTQWVTGTPSSISGLRYFVFKMGGDSSMGVWVNQLDDVEIWDGVTVAATGNEWKEEGT